MMRRSAGALALLLASPQVPVFRASTSIVAVDVSVKDGNSPVVGLKADDFSLADNNVPQRIESVGFANVPIDVTLVVDVSGSTSAHLAAYRRDVADIAATLRSIDRLRIITLEERVHEIVPLRPAGGPLPVGSIETGYWSSVYDGIAAALLRGADVGRRHLIVAYTDGFENRSILTGPQLLALSQSSDAVLHLVSPGLLPVTLESGDTCNSTSHWQRLVTRSTGSPPQEMERPVRGGVDCGPPLLQRTAEATGGKVHGGSALAGSFKKIFRDFMDDYVLYFHPTGVAASGWHDLSVQVVRKGTHYTVHARRGYSITAVRIAP